MRHAFLLVLGCLGTSTAYAQFTSVINVPPDVAPTGIDSQTQLNLRNGGSLPDFFEVGSPSGTSSDAELNLFGSSAFRPSVYSGGVLNVDGGLATNTEVFDGGVLSLLDGELFSFLTNPGSTVNIEGGRLSNPTEAQNGSTVNFRGGTVGTFEARSGSTISVSAGEFSDFEVSGGNATVTGGLFTQGMMVTGGQAAISGGRIEQPLGNREGDIFVRNSLVINNSGSATVSGGEIGTRLQIVGSVGTADTPDLRIVGTDFAIDGVPVTGLEEVGDIRDDFPNTPGASLTGTLQDGTPFAYGGNGALVDLRWITLEESGVPSPTGPPLIEASTDPVPNFIRGGQTLVVDLGGAVGDSFNAGSESRVEIRPGGTVGHSFSAAGATLDITGGSIGLGFKTFGGTTATISEGQFDASFETLPGSNVVITGGTFAKSSTLNGNVKVEGGSFGEDANWGIGGGDLVITNGTFEGLTVRAVEDGVISIRGGTFTGSFTGIPLGGQLKISGGSFQGDSQIVAFLPVPHPVELIGTEFFLDGLRPIGLISPGDSIIIENADLVAAERLTGVFLDGNPVDFVTQDVFSAARSIRLTLAVPEPDSVLLFGLALLLPAASRYRCSSMWKLTGLTVITVLLSSDAVIAQSYQLERTLNDPDVTNTFDADRDPGFGHAVDLYDGLAAIGDPRNTPDDLPGSQERGEVYLFQVETWTAHPLRSNLANSGSLNFGSAVSVGQHHIAVTSKIDVISAEGLVEIFDRAGNYEHTLFNPIQRDTGMDNFGYAIDIDGDRILIGAPDNLNATGEAVGQAFLFNLVTGELIQTFDDPTPTYEGIQEPIPGGDRFGASVSLQGDYVLIGAPWADVDLGPLPDGRSEVNKRAGEAHLFDALSGDLLHTYIDPEPTGDVCSEELLFCMPRERYSDDDAVYFNSQSHFGHAVTLEGTKAVIGDPGHDLPYIEPQENNRITADLDSGQVYVFDVATDEVLQSVGPPVEFNPFTGYRILKRNFGKSIAVEGDVVVVGAPEDYILVPNPELPNEPTTGKVYVVDISLGEVEQVLDDPDPTIVDFGGTLTSDEQFGHALAIDNGAILVGSRGHDGMFLDEGDAHYFSVGLNADFNGNGVVDAADYTVWRDNYGASGTDPWDLGDGDGDGDTDGADYLTWQRQYGMTLADLATAESASLAVPEPSSLLLLLLFAASLPKYRQRSRRA